MLTHPEFMLQASKDRQERIATDLHAAHTHEAGNDPGKVRRGVGNALIVLGERVGGHRAEPAWPPATHPRAHLV